MRVTTKIKEEKTEITETITKVSPYMVTAKTPQLNKNNTIAEYIKQLKSRNYTIEKYQICYEMKLNNKDWNTLMMSLLTNRECFKGKGGTSSSYNPGFEINTFKDFAKMNDLQSKLWRKNSFRDDCILVKCGWNSIVIDPQGYSYARYVGLDVKMV